MIELPYVPIYGVIIVNCILIWVSLPIILIIIGFNKNKILLLEFSINFILRILYKILKIIFKEYKIDNKIFAIGFDNASNNTTTIPQLITLCNPYFDGQFFHQRCTCHVLNLCVQNDLTLLQDYITPIRSALHYLWKHLQVMKIKNLLMYGVRFSLDVLTRWNFTYKLLSQSNEYKELLYDFMHYNINSIILHPT